MSKTHTAGWASDSPTPAQLKEFFAQIGSGRITKEGLQGFLRDATDWFTFTTSKLSLDELREKNPDLFVMSEDSWLKNQMTANKESQVRRLSLRTSAQPGSFSKSWDEQQKLLAPGEHVPTVRDLVEGMITHYRKSGKHLFPDYFVRMKDRSLPAPASRGDRYIIWSGVGGILIDWASGHNRESSIGLAVVRNSA